MSSAKPVRSALAGVRPALVTAVVAIVVAMVAPMSAPCFAAPAKPAPPTPIEKLVGGWTIARLDEWPDTCSLRLTRSPTIGGNATVLGRGCAMAFTPDEKARSWSDDVFSWRVNDKGGITLADATRHGLITFVLTSMGTGGRSWIGHGPDGQNYELMRDVAKKHRSKPKSDQ